MTTAVMDVRAADLMEATACSSVRMQRVVDRYGFGRVVVDHVRGDGKGRSRVRWLTDAEARAVRVYLALSSTGAATRANRAVIDRAVALALGTPAPYLVVTAEWGEAVDVLEGLPSVIAKHGGVCFVIAVEKLVERAPTPMH